MRHVPEDDGTAEHRLSIWDRATIGVWGARCRVCGTRLKLRPNGPIEFLLITIAAVWGPSEFIMATRPFSPAYVVYELTGLYVFALCCSVIVSAMLGSLAMAYIVGVEERS